MGLIPEQLIRAHNKYIDFSRPSLIFSRVMNPMRMIYFSHLWLQLFKSRNQAQSKKNNMSICSLKNWDEDSFFYHINILFSIVLPMSIEHKKVIWNVASFESELLQINIYTFGVFGCGFHFEMIRKHLHELLWPNKNKSVSNNRNKTAGTTKLKSSPFFPSTSVSPYLTCRDYQWFIHIIARPTTSLLNNR